MPVDTLLNQQMLAADQTLIRFIEAPNQPAGELTVPSAPGKMRLTTIGPGAVIIQKAEHAYVEEGYKALLLRSISAASCLETLELPGSLETVSNQFLQCSSSVRIRLHRHLSAATAETLQNISYPLPNGERLAAIPPTGIEELGLVRAISDALSTPLLTVHPEMVALFTDLKDESSVFCDRACYDLRLRRTSLDEHNLVMEMIRAGETGWRHAEAERNSDTVMRENRIRTWHMNHTLVTYRPGEIQKLPNGRMDICLTLTAREVFTPQVRPIRLRQKQYYLYSRNHMVRSADIPYQREDMGVFDENGLVTDYQITEAVYAKARLLLLL